MAGPSRTIRSIVRRPSRDVANLTLALACTLPAPVLAQAGAGAPIMTPGEAEAQEMGLTLASFCSPARHRAMGESQSVVDRGAEPLTGTASFLRSAEGTFLVFEHYDESLEGHCVVLGWFGGDLVSGPYRIQALAMSSLEAEVMGENRSFYAMAAVRTADESSIFVTEAGTLEIGTVEAGGLTGSFSLEGFVIEGDVRTDGMGWTGTFTAREPA